MIWLDVLNVILSMTPDQIVDSIKEANINRGQLSVGQKYFYISRQT